MVKNTKKFVIRLYKKNYLKFFFYFDKILMGCDVMKTLFIDTHSELLTVGVLIEDKLNKKEIESYNSHSVLLLPLLETILKEENIEIEDLDRIIVVNGPGSFTGIRIGLTVAKTIGYAKKIPVYPISSLKAYLVSTDTEEDKMAVIEDNKGYYICVYDKDNNEKLEEQYVDEIDEYNYNVVPEILDIHKICEYTSTFEPIKINALKANYVKKIEVEK